LSFLGGPGLTHESQNTLQNGHFHAKSALIHTKPMQYGWMYEFKMPCANDVIRVDDMSRWLTAEDHFGFLSVMLVLASALAMPAA
jgi:hypothetical protein